MTRSYWQEELSFEAKPDVLVSITENFEIEIQVPDVYPDILPSVRETGARIDSNYEHVFEDGSLCLAVPVEACMVFRQEPSLLGFVNRLIVPYLYGYCYWKQFGAHPFGERQHGADGIVQYYIETFKVRDEFVVLSFMIYLYKYGYSARISCPCGSGLRVRKCHRDVLRSLHDSHTPNTLLHDLESVTSICRMRFPHVKSTIPRYILKQVSPLLHEGQ